MSQNDIKLCMVTHFYMHYSYIVADTYATLFQIKLLCMSTSIGSQAPTLLCVAPSKGAAVLVEHEASAELDNVDDDYVWRGRRT